MDKWQANKTGAFASMPVYCTQNLRKCLSINICFWLLMMVPVIILVLSLPTITSVKASTWTNGKSIEIYVIQSREYCARVNIIDFLELWD